MARTELSINESTSHVVTATLKKLDATNTLVALASADIDSIEMTLIEVRSGDIINSRQKQDVFDANNCTMHATSGLFTWEVQPEDTEILNTGTQVGAIEQHLATFTVVWDTDKEMHFEIMLLVKNLRSVPQVAP